jgi:tetratricopeptide (TPR) repeat protein
VQAITAACARLPLALAIVAARAAAHPRFSLAALAAELRDSHARLDALTGEDPASDVRVVFSWSYQGLTAQAARLFRLLGLHPGPDISTAAAASLAGLPAPAVRPLLAELTHAHLILEHAPGRYTFHDLLRVYAAEQAHTQDSETDRHDALLRMLDHYLHTAHAAALLQGSAGEVINLSPVQPGVTPEHVTSQDRAVDWFDVEHLVLLGTVDLAATAGFDTHAWQLAATLDAFLERRGHLRDCITTQRAALAAANRLADPSARVVAQRLVGRAYTQLSRFDDAHSQLSSALSLYRQVGDQIGQAITHIRLGELCAQHGDHAQSLSECRQALELFRAAGDLGGEALALNDIGWTSAELGEDQQALATCQEAIALFQQVGDRFGEAITWDSAGYAHHHLGHHTEAIDCYERGLALMRDLGDRDAQGEIFAHLGRTHQAVGSTRAAREALQQALAIFEHLHHRDTEALRAELRRIGPLSDGPAVE